MFMLVTFPRPPGPKPPVFSKSTLVSSFVFLFKTIEKSIRLFIFLVISKGRRDLSCCSPVLLCLLNFTLLVLFSFSFTELASSVNKPI